MDRWRSLKTWQKWVAGIAAVFVVLIIIGALLPSEDDDKKSADADTDVTREASAEPEDTAEPEATAEPEDTPEPVLPSNQRQIGNLLLTVNGVAPHFDELFPAEAGTHYVAVDITALNNKDDSTYSLNANNFRLQDSDGFTGAYTVTQLEPTIGHHELVPGQSVRAFLVFKLGDGRTPTELQYQSFTGTAGTIPIP